MSYNVFVSKPNALSPKQKSFWMRFRRVLASSGLRPRTVGDTDFTNKPPVEAVRTVMGECRGAVVLGFRQTHVKTGTLKVGSKKASRVKDIYLSTPWNHLEGGMAYVLGLPMLIVREPKVEEGVFGIGSTDRFVHEAKLTTDWLASPQFLQPYKAWISEMHGTSRRATR